MLSQDIIREATRLTRAGQLVEATALLQRMLSRERAPDAHAELVHRTDRNSIKLDHDVAFFDSCHVSRRRAVMVASPLVTKRPSSYRARAKLLTMRIDESVS